MAKRPAPAERLDERLGALLEVEQRLAGQVAEAEAEASRRLEAARTGGERVAEAARQREAAAAEVQEREARAAHAAALEALQRAHEVTLGRLTGVTADAIDRLARRALARALGEGEGGS